MRYLLLILVILTLAACSKRIYVPVENPVEVPVTHDIYHVNTVHDSVHISDTVRIEQRGDTVFIDRKVIQWRQRLVHDTIRVTDSIPKIVRVPQPYPVTEVKEVNVLSWWQRILTVTGGLSLALAALWFAIRFHKR